VPELSINQENGVFSFQRKKVRSISIDQATEVNPERFLSESEVQFNVAKIQGKCLVDAWVTEKSQFIVSVAFPEPIIRGNVTIKQKEGWMHAGDGKRIYQELQQCLASVLKSNYKTL